MPGWPNNGSSQYLGMSRMAAQLAVAALGGQGRIAGRGTRPQAVVGPPLPLSVGRSM
jgi:hypothetical protein